MSELPETLATTPCTSGFTTASGRKENVTTEALQQARAIFNESDSKMSPVAKLPKPSSGTPTPCTNGFATASGKKENVTSEALQRARAFDESDCKMTPISTLPTKPFTMTPSTSGFTTASGRKENVSTEALQRARAILDESDCKISPVSPFQKPLVTTPRSNGFVTASGKKESVTNEALQRARSIFNEESDPKMTPISTLPFSKVFATTSGFTTASGRQESITSEALQQARSMFNESEAKMTPISRLPKTSATTPSTSGFTTASGRKESVTSEALQQARSMFNESDSKMTPTSTFHKPLATTPSTSGFITASGRKESVTNEALQRARSIFNENNSTDASPVSTFKPSASSPFLSATGRKESVTNDALQHARTLLGPTDSAEITASNSKRNFDDDISNSFEFCNQLRKKARMLEDEPKLKLVFSPTGTPDKDDEDDDQESPTFSSISLPTQSNESPVFDASCRRKSRTKFSQDSGSSPSVRRNLLPKKSSKVGPVVPQAGKLYRLREEKMSWPLDEELAGSYPETYTRQQLIDYGVLEDTINVSCENCQSFYFTSKYIQLLDESCRLSDGRLCLGDGAICDLDSNGGLPFENICQGFFAMDSVDESLISKPWVENHYKWIVWKLASLEKRFALYFGGIQLTPNIVMLQLKYRYDREIDKAQRSAIKKIAEGDDSAAKPMVLFISKIIKQTQELGSNMSGNTTVEVSDGWYSIQATFDNLLSKFVLDGIINVGTKLVIIGATLTGCENGHNPLELPPDVRLCLDANYVRRARWSAKLGFQNLKTIPCFPLSSLLVGGGLVPAVKLLICRVYPVMFLEKSSDGRTAWRTERMECLAADRFDRLRSAAVERILDCFCLENKTHNNSSQQVFECSQSQANDVSQPNVTLDMDSGEDIYKMLRKTADPTYAQGTLTEDQRRLLERYCAERRDKYQSKLREELEKTLKEHEKEIPTRAVSSILRIRVRCLIDHQTDTQSGTILSIYSPTEGLIELLKEGQTVIAENLLVNTVKQRRNAWSEALPSTSGHSISLSSSKSTRFSQTQSTRIVPELFIPRECTSFAELCDSHFEAPWNEVDFVAAIVSLRNEKNCDIVYFCDEKYRFVAVRFWGTLQAMLLKDLVSPGHCVAVSNVSHHQQHPNVKIPYFERTDRTAISSNPRQKHLASELARLICLVKEDNDYWIEARKRLQHAIGMSRVNSSPLLSANNSITSATTPTSPSVLQCPVRKLTTNTMSIVSSPAARFQFKTPLKK